MKHPGHTYGGFVPAISERGMTPTKTHYPANPKPSFNPKRGVKRESPKPREEAFVSMFCGHAGHLDEFCFQGKRIKRRRVEYARNSYHDEFIDFPARSYSHVPPHFYSRASPRTSSRAFPSSPMDLAITYMVLVHERTILSLNIWVTTHVLVVVFVFHVCLVFLSEGATPTLS
jgi:hypothetical protein